MRITTLGLIQWSKGADGDDNERPKKVWEKSDNCGKLHNVDRKGQIERLIIIIATYEVSAPVMAGRRNEGGMNSHEHKGAPTNTRLDMRQITRCSVGTMGILTHSTFFVNSGHFFSRGRTTHLHQLRGCYHPGRGRSPHSHL